MIRVLIVDDHAVVRRGLRALLETRDNIEVVGEAASGAEALRMCAEAAPGLVLMDLLMPGLSGAEATLHIKAKHPEIRVAILTSYAQDEFLLPAIQAGAESYLLKDIEANDLIDAVERTARGEAVLQPAVAQRVMKALRQGASEMPPAEKLTERETGVLDLVAEGLTNIEIADRLFISEKTVKTHVSSILGKLGVEDRTKAAVAAWRERMKRAQWTP